MAWHIMFVTAEIGRDEERRAAAAARYPGAAAAVLLDQEVVAVYVPVRLTDEQAALLAEHPGLIPGSGRLQWFEVWMADDVERTHAAASRAAGRESAEGGPPRQPN